MASISPLDTRPPARHTDSAFVRRDLFTNAVAQGWIALLSLVFVPVYLRLLGVDAYGVVTFFTALQAALAFLDLGLSATATREFSSSESRPDEKARTALLLALERVYVAVAAGIALGVLVAAQWIATSWLNASGPSVNELGVAVATFGVVLGFRWPTSLYVGVLRGQGRHSVLNVVQIATATIRHGGAVAALLLVDPSLRTFVLWQVVSALIEVTWLRIAAWRPLHGVTAGHAGTAGALARVWRFSAGVALASMLAAVLKQTDKLVLSAALPLEQLAYYGIANSLASTVLLVVLPFQNTALPAFSRLWHEADTGALAAAYHRNAQLVSFVASPVAAVLVLFSRDLLWSWTRNADVAQQGGGVLELLALAGMLNAMMVMPVALQFACGLTRIAVWNNAIAVLLFVPTSVYLIGLYGIIGPALAWLLFNAAYYLVTPWFVHRHVLRGHQREWRWSDTVPFMIGSLLLATMVRGIQIQSGSPALVVLAALVAAVVYVTISATRSEAVRMLFLGARMMTETR